MMIQTDAARLAQRAIQLAQGGSFEAAAVAFQQAIELNPNHAELRCQYAALLQSLPHFDEAIMQYRAAIRLAPNFASTYSKLGQLLTQQGDFEAALVELKQAIRLQPNDASTYNHLGKTLCLLGQREESITAYRQAVQVDPENAKAYSQIGCLLSEQGQMEDAILAYRTALRLRPHASDYYKLGVALQQQGHGAAAIAAFRQTIHLQRHVQQRSAEAHISLCAALVEQHQWTEAVTVCQQATRLDVQEAQAKLNLGLALMHQDEPEAALFHFQAAKALAQAQGRSSLIATLEPYLQQMQAQQRSAPQPSDRQIALRKKFKSLRTDLLIAVSLAAFLTPVFVFFAFFALLFGDGKYLFYCLFALFALAVIANLKAFILKHWGIRTFCTIISVEYGLDSPSDLICRHGLYRFRDLSGRKHEFEYESCLDYYGPSGDFYAMGEQYPVDYWRSLPWIHTVWFHTQSH